MITFRNKTMENHINNKRKRKALSLDTKFEIIEKHNKFNKKTSELAAEYDLPVSKVSTILNKDNQNKILEHFDGFLN